ncbi:hypothetical protein [Phocaeicola sp.]|uniref:hypothetical protein n=1 Tax=Phocaeicola sp. TaxID=2773926 RepID=UPI0023C67A23|nr:hypothetical protein [Phocaeicola sp.]MDE5677275.1 hypothetical protein [Phocaeicola sp.]
MSNLHPLHLPFILSLAAETPCRWGGPRVKGHFVGSLHPPFIGTQKQHGLKLLKTDVKGLMPVAERGVRGCPIIFNRLIDNRFCSK